MKVDQTFRPHKDSPDHGRARLLEQRGHAPEETLATLFTVPSQLVFLRSISVPIDRFVPLCLQVALAGYRCDDLHHLLATGGRTCVRVVRLPRCAAL